MTGFDVDRGDIVGSVRGRQVAMAILRQTENGIADGVSVML
ncbi:MULTISPECIES: hypothetical protein [Mycobacterium]|nr:MULTISPECIES: hypothetical protein [Mycobacterium]MDP7729635.1 hypothetical protein [Mycobacterium sp. TY813]